MNRSLSIACGVSVIAHVLVLLLLTVFLNPKTEPELDSLFPVLHFQLGRSEDGEKGDEIRQDAEPSVPSAQEKTVQSEKQITRAPKPTNLLSGQVTPTHQVSSEQTPIEAKQPDQVTAQSADSKAEPPTVNTDTLTTTAWSDHTVSNASRESEELVAETRVMSAKQEKMLNKKFKRWAENLHKMDTADIMMWQHKGQEYTATFRRLMPATETSIEQVMVEISTVENGHLLSTQMQMRRLAFSNFAQFVNRWDPNVQVHNDELDGRFHVNSDIYLGYSRKVQPTFHGKVTTSSRRVNFANTSGVVKRHQMFLGGLETGVKRIQLPKKYLPFPTDTPVDGKQIHRLEGDTRLTFFSNGTYSFEAPGSSGGEDLRWIADTTTYIIGPPKSKLFVSGTVNGKVLVYSPERIVIEGNLIYARDPVSTPDGDDYLGLVSDKYVEIAHPSVTGPGDLRIHASIYAKRRFVVKNYRTRENSLLHIYGSLTAGSLSATEPRYYTKIQFDKRLETLRAPGFPVTNRYEMTSWDRKWRVNTQ